MLSNSVQCDRASRMELISSPECGVSYSQHMLSMCGLVNFVWKPFKAELTYRVAKNCLAKFTNFYSSVGTTS